MRKITAGIILILFIILAASYARGKLRGPEPLFKPDTCARDDEMGVLYKVGGTFKSQTHATVLQSWKYPSGELYRIGASTHWPARENKLKLVEAPCP